MENLPEKLAFRVRHNTRRTLTGTGLILLLVGFLLVYAAKRTKLLDKIESPELRKALTAAAAGIGFILVIIAEIFFSKPR